MKFVVIDRPQYVVEVEPHSFGTICHVAMKVRWTRTVKRLIFFDLARLHAAYGDLHAFVVGDNPKLRHFLTLLGFHFDQTRLDDDGVPHDFYRKLSPWRQQDLPPRREPVG